MSYSLIGNKLVGTNTSTTTVGDFGVWTIFVNGGALVGSSVNENGSTTTVNLVKQP